MTHMENENRKMKKCTPKKMRFTYNVILFNVLRVPIYYYYILRHTNSYDSHYEHKHNM